MILKIFIKEKFVILHNLSTENPCQKSLFVVDSVPIPNIFTPKEFKHTKMETKIKKLEK